MAFLNRLSPWFDIVFSTGLKRIRCLKCHVWPLPILAKSDLWCNYAVSPIGCKGLCWIPQKSNSENNLLRLALPQHNYFENRLAWSQNIKQFSKHTVNNYLIETFWHDLQASRIKQSLDIFYFLLCTLEQSAFWCHTDVSHTEAYFLATMLQRYLFLPLPSKCRLSTADRKCWMWLEMPQLLICDPLCSLSV